MKWHTRGTAGHDTHGQSAVYDESGKDIAIVYDGKAHGALLAAAPAMDSAIKQAMTQIGEWLIERDRDDASNIDEPHWEKLLEDMRLALPGGES